MRREEAKEERLTDDGLIDDSFWIRRMDNV